jgi:hypothetical protein
VVTEEVVQAQLTVAVAVAAKHLDLAVLVDLV